MRNTFCKYLFLLYNSRIFLLFYINKNKKINVFWRKKRAYKIPTLMLCLDQRFDDEKKIKNKKNRWSNGLEQLNRLTFQKKIISPNARSKHNIIWRYPFSSTFNESGYELFLNYGKGKIVVCIELLFIFLNCGVYSNESIFWVLHG